MECKRQTETESGLVVDMGRTRSTTCQGQREAQRERVWPRQEERAEEGKQGERRQRAREGVRVPGLRFLLIFSFSFIFVPEAAVGGGGGLQGGNQVPEGKRCRAKRNPFRTAQNRTRTFEQPQRGAEILEPKDQEKDEAEEICLGNLRQCNEGPHLEADYQASRGHGNARKGDGRKSVPVSMPVLDQDSTGPDLISYNAAIASCESATRQCRNGSIRRGQNRPKLAAADQASNRNCPTNQFGQPRGRGGQAQKAAYGEGAQCSQCSQC